MPTKLLTIFSTLFFALFINQVNARTYYVNDASLVGDVYCKAIGNTMNDGLSPLKPKASLKQLYTAYNQFADGDTIYIDAGTYKAMSTSSLESGYTFSKNIVIIGAGSANTILDNNNKGNMGSNTYFATITGSVTIKNIQFKNYNYDKGGQVLNINSTGNDGVELSDVFFNSNGGASGNSAIVIGSNCKVSISGDYLGFSACNGANESYTTCGGININGKGTTVNISNYAFIGNKKYGGAGAALSVTNADTTTFVNISNSIFIDNMIDSDTPEGGGAIFCSSGNLSLNDCILTANKLYQLTVKYGGAAYFTGGNHLFKRVKVFNNSNKGGSTYGTIALRGGSLTILDSYFSDNLSDRGNDIYLMSGNISAKNTAFGTVGSSLYNVGGTFTISDCGNPTRTGTITVMNTNTPTLFINPKVPTYIGDCSTGISVPCPNTLEYAKYFSVCPTKNEFPTTFSPEGGFFNTSEGLTINKKTGEIDLSKFTSGSYSISYFAGGCSVSKTFSVGAGGLSGEQAICQGGTTTFSSTISGGSWNSSDNTIATVSSLGVITGISAGTAVISYTVAGQGCLDAISTRSVTVTAKPIAGTISGVTTLCGGTTSQLSSSSLSGKWSISDAKIATIDYSSGLLTAVNKGSATVTYTVFGTGGCSNATASESITINGAPSTGVLSGAQTICLAGTNTFTSTVAGGTWSSGDPSIATINSSSGLITNIKVGTVTMTYTQAGVNGCPARTATQTLTITTSPSAGVISGNTSVCSGTTTTLTSNLLGGSWSSASTTVARVNTSTGVVTPVAAGPSVITYTIPTTGGCAAASATKTINVITSPTIAGTTPASRCDAGTLTLGATTSSGTISWYATSTGGASLGSGTTFTTPSISATTTYYAEVISGSCASTPRTAVIATIIPKPTITGVTDATRCGTGTVILGAKARTDTINWYSSITGGTILGTGISFTTPSISSTTTYYVDVRFSGCTSIGRTAVKATVTNSIPTIAGVSNVCVGSTTSLTGSSIPNASTPWTSFNTSIATVTNTGIVNGLTAGTSVISYMDNTGCVATLSVTVNSIDNPSFSYPTNSFCKLDADPIPTISGTKGGTFTFTPTGLMIDKNSGAISLVASQTGSYTVTYATNGNCPSSAFASISIGSSPVVDALADQSICAGAVSNEIKFTGSPGTVFTWVNSNKATGLTSSGTGNLPAFIGNNSGNTPIGSLIMVTSQSGSCVGTQQSFKITVQPKDLAQIHYSSTQYCSSDSDPIPFISGTTGGVFSATPSGLVIDASTGKISLANSSKGNYAVFYNTTGMCPSEMQWDINIGTSSSNLTIVTSSGKTSFCVGDSLQLIAQGATKYLWNTGKKDNFITVKTPGKYTVSSNEGVCSNSVSLEISIDTVRVQMYIPSLVGFNNGSIILNGTPKEGTFSGIGVNNNTFDPKLAGLGVKKITFSYVSPNNCSAQASQNILVYDTVNTNCTVTKYDTLKVTKYDTVTYTNNVTKYDTVKVTKYDTVTFTNNVTKYDTVTVKNNVYDTVTITNNVTKYDTVLVNKTIYDTVTIKNNVYDTITITNNVTKYDTVLVTEYDTITVTNNVTKYDTITLTDTVSILKIKFKLTTGIQANQMASMSLYPNPTSDVLHIEVGDAKALEGYRYRILDALGKEVYNELVKNTITEIPLKTLGAAGMYQLEVLDQNNSNIQTNKIVLQ